MNEDSWFRSIFVSKLSQAGNQAAFNPSTEPQIQTFLLGPTPLQRQIPRSSLPRNRSVRWRVRRLCNLKKIDTKRKFPHFTNLPQNYESWIMVKQGNLKTMHVSLATHSKWPYSAVLFDSTKLGNFPDKNTNFLGQRYQTLKCHLVSPKAKLRSQVTRALGIKLSMVNRSMFQHPKLVYCKSNSPCFCYSHFSKNSWR